MRVSQYLENKCEALAKAISFFRGDVGGTWKMPGKERRFVFLAQIDFWDWEMDELIYSIESFKQRSQAWEINTSGLGNMLIQQGIPIQEKELWEAVRNRWWSGKNDVVAPVDKVNAVIEAWNNLLALCEETIMKPKKLIKQHKEAYGVACLENLDKFRKKKIDDGGCSSVG